MNDVKIPINTFLKELELQQERFRQIKHAISVKDTIQVNSLLSQWEAYLERLKQRIGTKLQETYEKLHT